MKIDVYFGPGQFYRTLGAWLPRHPRWLNRLYARCVGFFWLRCPVCSRWYGGHEAAPRIVAYVAGKDNAQMVCWRCAT